MGANQQGADATAHRWLVIPRTLCFVTYQDNVLLMKRSATRRVFPNQYNGLGGHIERDETPYEGAIREVREESGLEVNHVILRGIHMIDAGKTTGILLFVFTAEAVTPDFVDNGEEGSLHWIKRKDVLSLDLVEDLPSILPKVLEMASKGESSPYHVHVSYDDQDTIQLKFSEGR